MYKDIYLSNYYWNSNLGLIGKLRYILKPLHTERHKIIPFLRDKNKNLIEKIYIINFVEIKVLSLYLN